LSSSPKAASKLTDERVLAVCAIASILPLFCTRHLPMTDLPEHLASMATLRHHADPAWRSHELFEVAGVFDTPYWLCHVVGALLAAVLGSAERAGVAMLAAVGLGYPYALRALLVSLRRDPRLALFGCVLFWSTNLFVGLLNFVASVPVVLAALALVVRNAEERGASPPPARRAWRWAGLAVLGVAIFYLHSASFLLFVVQVAIVTTLAPRFVTSPATTPERGLARLAREARDLALRLSWLLPAAGVGLAVSLVGRTVGTGHGPALLWFSRVALLKGLFGWLFDRFHSGVDDVLGGAVVALLGFLFLAVREKAPSAEERWRSRCGLSLFAASVVFWLAMPSKVGTDVGLLDVRMGVFVVTFAVVLPRVLPGRRATLAFALTAATGLAISAHTAYEVRGFDRDDVAGFDDVLRVMPRGKRLVMLNLDPRSSHVKFGVMPYFGSYYHARYGGIASYSFSETAHWPIHYRPGSEPPSKTMTWANPCGYDNERDGAYFDYVLVRTLDRDPMTSGVAGPRWELIGSSRSWRLYRKSSAPPIPSSGAPAPGPCGA